MPELPVIQNLNPTVFKTTTLTEISSDDLLSAALRFISQSKRSFPNPLPTIPFVRNNLATLRGANRRQ